jgi:hypothetical protein
MNHGARVKVNIIRSWQEASGFYLLAIFTSAAFLLYIFFIGQTVFRLVQAKNLKSEKLSLTSEISRLELQNLALNDTISLETAKELGFVAPAKTEYMSDKAHVSLR